ncbi:xylose isomerase-like protein [Aureobasidium sp. EXF-8845]|nr:xylose isomerase-like protein [Aureobasidium sp. EXF-8845]KAI4857589.1 xylose isomerase-like protein [Aureobasidium sp. EXF-8846]
MTHQLGISTMSLGRAWVHDLEPKLDQAAKYGYEGLEIFYEDLIYHAKKRFGDDTPANQIKAAEDIYSMCKSRNISIINIQPFMHYDGLIDRQKHAERIEDLKLWFKLAHALHTDMIAVPASFLPASECTGDMSIIVADLQELADLGAAQNPPLRFAYEALCWSTHVQTWEHSWEIVSAVDRPNFGLCLDTFNIAGRIYADPTQPSGKRPTADADLATAIAAKLVRPDKLFFVQVVDAERLDSPLVEGHPFYDKDQLPRMSWSRNCRLFYGEQDRGGYLPIREILKAILHDLGYTGYLSFELFNRSMADPSPDTPAEHARRGAESFAKMVADLELNGHTAADSAVSVSSSAAKA